MNALNKVQVSAFERDGFLLLPGLFTDAELDAMRREADRILELSVNASLALGRRHPRMDAVCHDDGTLTLRKIQPVSDLSETIAAISTHPSLLEPMRQLMGDEPVLMEEKLNFKQTVDLGGEDFSFLKVREDFAEGFALHHDWGYYRQQGYPENTLSSAVAIDGCAGRGPIRVIPGSHLVDAPMRDPDPRSGSGVVADGAFDIAELTPMDAEAGSVMLFHAKLVHDSEPNRSGLPRRVMIYSHYPRSHDPHGDPDRRNGPLRSYSRDFEERYRVAVETGAYVDRFRLAASQA